MYLHLINSDFQTVMDFYSNTTNHTVMTTAEIRIHSGPQVAFLPTFILPLCPHCFDIGLGLLTSTQGQTFFSGFPPPFTFICRTAKGSAEMVRAEHVNPSFISFFVQM